jgi:hypothetical protein
LHKIKSACNSLENFIKKWYYVFNQ